MKKNEVNFHDAVKELLETYKLTPQLHEVKIKALWEHEMGKTINQYTTQLSLNKNILTITINSAPLRNELNFSKDKIINRLNEHLGEDVIKEVIIR